jgi:hypothetical protein
MSKSGFPDAKLMPGYLQNSVDKIGLLDYSIAYLHIHY